MPVDEHRPPDVPPEPPMVDVTVEVRRFLPEATTASPQRIGLAFEDRHGVRGRLYVPTALVPELLALVNGCLSAAAERPVAPG